jgi:hypothetical protein
LAARYGRKAMKIRPDEGELAAQIRRLMTQANPSLQRFRGLGAEAPVTNARATQPAPAPKPSTGGSRLRVPPRPAIPQGSSPTASRSSPQANAGLLLDTVGSFDDARIPPDLRLAPPQAPALPGEPATRLDRAEPPEHARVPQAPVSPSPDDPTALRERLRPETDPSLRGAAELKARRDAAGMPGEARRPELGLPQLDPRSAAELQVLIALHARAPTPFATALAEIRANSPKTQRKPAQAGPTRDEHLRRARSVRVRTYVVLAALFGLVSLLALAKSCSGA